MRDPSVGQAQMLASEFLAALDRSTPKSCAVLGCATGNGFEHLRARDLERVVAVDINPQYLELLRAQFSQSVPNLETVCADIASPDAISGMVEHIWAGLVFEYVDPRRVLANAARWLAPHGAMTVLLQEPSESLAEISPTRFQQDLVALGEVMRLVSPDELTEHARELGFRPGPVRRVTAQGKRFFVGDFRIGS